jgi:hypothetical protein
MLHGFAAYPSPPSSQEDSEDKFCSKFAFWEIWRRTHIQESQPRRKSVLVTTQLRSIEPRRKLSYEVVLGSKYDFAGSRVKHGVVILKIVCQVRIDVI